ncbi:MULTISPECIES: glycosyltransferase family 2 protein [unclassified Colwellia]|uniref:glycosyltransferase family 2 protein n=1 Tax=unclassified Colwellia TaxID=196834 RepID=UPI0015F51E07|nr:MULTISPECIES: glycosyltransferase [unclassified Colwellia]MBA6234364.1 glycosyltransferase family 2 protein [Colwellia sp. MB02u-7]MBA6237532.1 glycosyltransferase family 2 protein [Colwellia sp. MB02u-11]MBA6256273.1 glycosyltransferase family 2 protein [Colwellia sp. MB3u-28]MBA6260157.1 glycosyltransferase family 2 protein [Colwellia sp. MB3u-41]MBA6300164.1 glycosyltransferase family 2 protein [Colwellia sp. MB3u-22]
MSSPLISIVIASYNMGQYLGTALDSLLKQTWENIEVIVIDDGSTDNSEEVMSAYTNNNKVSYIKTENRGQTKAKNRGVKEAKGDFIGFCDADDFWTDNKLELQMPFFSDDKVGVVYSEVSYIDEDGNPYDKAAPYERYTGKVTEQLLTKNFVPFGTSIIRKACVIQDGGFDEQFKMGIDWDLWLRYSLNWEFMYCPDKTYIYREWSGQMSNNYRGRYDFAFRILQNFVSNHGEHVSQKSINTAWADMYINRGLTFARAEKTFIAPLKDIVKGISLSVFDLSGWKSLVRLLLRRP